MVYGPMGKTTAGELQDFEKRMLTPALIEAIDDNAPENKLQLISDEEDMRDMEHLIDELHCEEEAEEAAKK